MDDGDGAEQRIQGRGADRRGVGDPHRRRAHRPVHAGRSAQEIEGDEYRGMVKVKVGPITAQYKGTASFIEKDDSSYRAVLAPRAVTRGARATPRPRSRPADARRRRHERRSSPTSSSAAGSPSSAGACMADVSTKLLGQFVDCLEAKLGDAAPPNLPRAPRSDRLAPPRPPGPPRWLGRHGPGCGVPAEGAPAPC